MSDKDLEDAAKAAEETIEENVEGPEQKQVQLPQQHHQFLPVQETSRTYVYPNDQRVRVDHVFGLSVKPDGGHRLLTRTNVKMGYTMAPGWITIIHEVNDESVDGYVFTE